MVGIGKGAENNILIKDAEALELAHKMNAIALDKTGTITEGKPSVTGIEWINENERKNGEKILFSLESLSEHPLAGSIVEYFKGKEKSVALSDVESVTGKGISGVYGNTRYFAGGARYLADNKISVDQALASTASGWEEDANSVVFFADNRKAIAAISLSDKIKKESPEAVKKLRELGIDVYLVTGDNHKTAEAIARKAGIKEIRAEMMPSDKADFINSLKKEGKVTGMAGDGINDSQALATADVSIAMGKGSDIAIDAARMTIISNNLSLIPVAVRLSRNTVRTIRQNLFWAFIYNFIGIPIAAGVLYPLNGFLLNPMIAGAAMALSSISVVSNSLRLKYSK
jgi:Cu2+-exporting ATPase